MPDVVKKITMPLEGDPSKLNKDIDKARKDAKKKGVEIPVSIDLSKIEGSLKGIIAIVDRLDQRFDKLFGSTNKDINQFKSSINNFKKEISDTLGKVNELIRYIGKSKTPYINVGVMGFENLTQQVKTLVEDMKTLNSTNVNIDSFEKLLEVLKNIEKLTNSIVKGMNFDAIRPSSQILSDIEKAENGLKELSKAEKEYEKYAKKLSGSTANKIFRNFFADGDFSFAELNDFDFEKYINYLKEYIALGGDLKKIKIGSSLNSDIDISKLEAIKNMSDSEVDNLRLFYDKKDVRTLEDVYNLLVLIKKINPETINNETAIKSDLIGKAAEVDKYKNSLKDLNSELAEAQAREDRDLKVSIDTKSLDEFSAAITQALSKLENIKINIPEGTTFDGLSAENLNKIIGKLDEIVVNIRTISSLISTGIDTSKLENIEVGIESNVDVAEFIRKIEEKLDNAVVNVKTNIDLSNEEKIDDNLVDDSVFTNLKPKFKEVADDFGFDLSQSIETVFSEEFNSLIQNVDFDNLFSSLRNTLSDIVVQFQNSLNNVTFSGEQKNEIYNLLKQWKDASGIISRTRNTDAERAALLNQSNGKISNSYLFDKEGSFHGLILNELNRLESGVSGQIGELYDTWLHSHPFRKAEQGLKAIGSDIGFTVADIDLFKNKYLDEGVSNMMVSSNGKYANINWDGISKEIIEQVVRAFKASNIFDESTGRLVANKTNGIITENGYYDFDKQSELMRSALINSMKSAGINDADSRFTFGNIEDLKNDLSHLHQGEQQAAEEAKELIEIFRKLGTVLDGFNGESFKFGISEESLNGVISKLNEIVGLLKIIGRLDDDNVNVDSTVNDNVITAGVKPNVSGYDFVTEIEKEISGYKVPVGVKPDVEGYTFVNQIENEIGSVPVGVNVTPYTSPSEFIYQIENDIQNVGHKIKIDVEPSNNSLLDFSSKFQNAVDDTYMYNDGVSSESSQFENLEQKIKDVTAAVDNKTRAFQEEEQIVVGTVQREVTNLEVLDGQLLQVLSTIKEIKEAFSDSFNDNGFLSSINSLLERSDDLKNLVKVLELSKQELKDINNISDKNTKSSKRNNKQKSSTLTKTSDLSAEDIVKITNQSLSNLEKYKNVGSGETYSKVFEKIKQEIIECNNQLITHEIELDEYERKVIAITNNLDKKNILGYIDDEDIEKAKIAMDEYAQLLSSGQAEWKSVRQLKNGDKYTYTWEDQDKMVHNLSMSYDYLNDSLIKTHNQTKQTAKSTRGFSQILKQGWQNVMQYTLSFVGFYEIIELVRKGVTVVKDLDTAFTEMRKVSDESVQSLRNFQDISFDIADKIGTTAQQIQQSTADWMRLGESLNEASISAEASNILFNVSEFENIDAATESLVAMSSAYSEFEKIEIVDKLNNIGNNYAIATDGIATALQRSASALQTAGNDIDEAIALVTAGNAVVQNPDSVGAGLRTIALRITGTEAAKAELEELGEDTEDFVVQTKAKSQEAIKDFTSVASNNFEGFDILDDNGNFKSTYEILLGIAEIYDEIVASDQQFGTNKANGLLETLAGKNRSNIAASIIQNPEILKSVYEDSQDSEGSALEENEKYLESIEGHIAQLKNKWQEVWASSLNREQINFFLDLGKALLGIVETIGLLPSAGIIGALIGGTVYSDKIKAIPGIKEALD